MTTRSYRQDSAVSEAAALRTVCQLFPNARGRTRLIGVPFHDGIFAPLLVERKPLIRGKNKTWSRDKRDRSRHENRTLNKVAAKGLVRSKGTGTVVPAASRRPDRATGSECARGPQHQLPHPQERIADARDRVRPQAPLRFIGALRGGPAEGVAGDAYRLPLRGMPFPHATCKCQIFRGPRSGSKTNYCCISPSRIVLFSRQSRCAFTPLPYCTRGFSAAQSAGAGRRPAPILLLASESTRTTKKGRKRKCVSCPSGTFRIRRALRHERYKAGIRKGHTGSIAAQLSPSNETLPSELGDADYAFLHPYVLFMFLHDSKQANESEL